MSDGNGDNDFGELTIPILTDVVAQEELADAQSLADLELEGISEAALAELQTRLASEVYKVVDELIQNAFQEMEAALFQQVSNRLRCDLPELVDRILRNHFGSRAD